MSLHDYVEEYFRSATPAGQIVSATDLSVSGRTVAFCAGIAEAAGQTPRRRIAALELDTGRLIFADDEAEAYLPRWSPDGNVLAWVTDRDGGTTIVLSGGDLTPQRRAEMSGYAEFLRWSPDGSSLLIGVADPGSQLSDVVGSGTLAPASDAPSWAPRVDTGTAQEGWRRLWVWRLDAAAPSRLPIDDRNVWQADWHGPDRIVAVVSPGPTESDWYKAALVSIPLGGGTPTTLPTHGRQLGCPTADASGVSVSVIDGLMSDRGLYTGQLLVNGEAVDTLGVDVTDQCWVDADQLLFTGQRGLQTVIGSYTLSTAATVVEWESDEATGGYRPEVGAYGDTIVAWLHSYAQPPRLVEIVDGKELTAHQPTGFPAAPGTCRAVSWTSADGMTIEGLLVTPDSPGPHPLIVHVHGGPVWCWRNEWSMHYPFTPVLVGQGYAVLHPNHRASSGRGQDFIAAGLHAMGGPDAADIVSGVESLVNKAIADPARVVVTGNSYGGFMAAWLAATSDKFQAAIARSPVTDWVSQHYASNLPGFDQLCLDGEPLDAQSDYRRRSPLYFADDITIPMLHVAGARDLATPPAQAQVLHNALVERGRKSTLVIYPEEGHGVRAPEAIIDLCVRMLTFLERELATFET